MRLINARTLRFEDFTEGKLPRYAILSHTWGDEEVTYMDMAQAYLPTKSGYHKITQTCRLALDLGIEYAWVDTCCIDKISSAELTESINSTFQRYEKAAACFAHTGDLKPGIAFGEGIGQCRWFSRGWTLQELIAPPDIFFYDLSWTLRGTKLALFKELAEATWTPSSLLLGKSTVLHYSVARRMSWASSRTTTRLEDAAYSFFGIFEVNMPLIYGEGIMAFRRLQEEILKCNNDVTIFAWNPTSTEQGIEHCSMLATSPAAFSGSGYIVVEPVSFLQPGISDDQ